MDTHSLHLLPLMDIPFPSVTRVNLAPYPLYGLSYVIASRYLSTYHALFPLLVHSSHFLIYTVLSLALIPLLLGLI